MSSPPPPPVPEKSKTYHVSQSPASSSLNISTTIGSVISNSHGKLTVMTSTSESSPYGPTSPPTSSSHPATATSHSTTPNTHPPTPNPHPTTPNPHPTTSNPHPTTSNPQQPGMTVSRRTSTASAISAQSARQEDHVRERNALFGAFRLSLKSLMETHAGTGIAVQDEDEHLERFCTIVEHLLRHGFKSKVRGVETVGDASMGFFFIKAAAWSALGGRRDVWDFIKDSMKIVRPEATPSVLKTIMAMESLKTNISRLRAWIRLTLMEQTFTEWMSALVDRHGNRALLKEYYESWAFLRSGEILAATGMMQSLNTIEINLCLKGDDLEARSGQIDWVEFLREVNLSGMDVERSRIMEAEEASIYTTDSSDHPTLLKQLATHAEQIQYVEQQCKDLQIKLAEKTRLGEEQTRRIQELEQSYSLMELQRTKDERSSLREEIHRITESHNKQVQLLQQNMDLERRAYRESRASLADVFAKLESLSEDNRTCRQKLLATEQQLRQMQEQQGRDANTIKAFQERLVLAIKAKEEWKEKAVRLAELLARRDGTGDKQEAEAKHA